MFHRSPGAAARTVVALTASAAVFIGSAGAARADVKIVSTLTSSGNRSSGPRISAVTTYYKGKWARTETPQNVLIVDNATGKIYSLNPAEKTYNVVSFAEIGKNPLIAMMDMKTTVSLKPGGQTKTILGKPTKSYVYTAVLQMSLKKEALQRMAAMNGGAVPSKPPTIPPVTIKGVNWVTEAVKVSTGASSAAMATLSQMPGMKALAEKFSSVRGVPLEQEVTVISAGGPQGSVDQTSITKATRIDESPLPDSLFKVPPGYREVPRPVMPGMGRGAGPGGMRHAPASAQ
jgi:hypothetical protein